LNGEISTTKTTHQMLHDFVEYIICIITYKICHWG